MKKPKPSFSHLSSRHYYVGGTVRRTSTEFVDLPAAFLNKVDRIVFIAIIPIK